MTYYIYRNKGKRRSTEYHVWPANIYVLKHHVHKCLQKHGIVINGYIGNWLLLRSEPERGS